MWACLCCSTWRAPSGPIKRGPVRSGPSERGFEVEAGRVGSSGGPVPGDDVPGRERLRGGQRGQPHGEGPRERATVHAPRGAPHVLHVQPLRRARLHAPFVMSRIKKVHVSARVILIFTAARTIGSTVISRQQTADSRQRKRNMYRAASCSRFPGYYYEAAQPSQERAGWVSD